MKSSRGRTWSPISTAGCAALLLVACILLRTECNSAVDGAKPTDVQPPDRSARSCIAVEECECVPTVDEKLFRDDWTLDCLSLTGITPSSIRLEGLDSQGRLVFSVGQQVAAGSHCVVVLGVRCLDFGLGNDELSGAARDEYRATEIGIVCLVYEVVSNGQVESPHEVMRAEKKVVCQTLSERRLVESVILDPHTSVGYVLAQSDEARIGSIALFPDTYSADRASRAELWRLTSLPDREQAAGQLEPLLHVWLRVE